MDDEGEDVIEVWDIYWPLLEVFLALETQWQLVVAGGGLTAAKPIWTGINYAAADVVIRRHGFADDDREVLEGLKVMEVAALNAMNGGDE